VKSRDDNQLLGKTVIKDNISTECDPYGSGAGGLVYAPCGAIANSLFNDTFELAFNGADNGSNIDVPLLRTGIAWSTDKNVKFAQGNYNNTLKPKNWVKRVDELDTEDPSNNGYQNEDLIVWMRTAALPNFRKLFRRVDHSKKNFSDGLPAGYYTLTVQYNYPVTVFEGSKYFVISTTSWLGGKNPFLGIAYLVVGVLCVILGFVFLTIHLMYGKRINEEYNQLKTLNEVQ